MTPHAKSVLIHTTVACSLWSVFCMVADASPWVLVVGGLVISTPNTVTQLREYYRETDR